MLHRSTIASRRRAARCSHLAYVQGRPEFPTAHRRHHPRATPVFLGLPLAATRPNTFANSGVAGKFSAAPIRRSAMPLTVSRVLGAPKGLPGDEIHDLNAARIRREIGLAKRLEGVRVRNQGTFGVARQNWHTR